MTVADSTTSQERLALARLRQDATGRRTPPQGPIIHKPAGDMADLLVMSTVDQKTPAEAPGSADLLETLVKEGATAEALDAAQEADVRAAEIAAEEELLAARQPETPGTSAEQSVSLLQREIEMLLRDTPEIAPETGAAANSEPFGALGHEVASAEAGAGVAARAPAAAASGHEVTAAELDVLLSRAADEVGAEAGPTNSVVEGQTEESADEESAAALVAEMRADGLPAADAPALPRESAAVAGATEREGGASGGPKPEGPVSAASISEQIFAEQLDRLMASSPAAAAAAAAVPEDSEGKLTEAEGVLAEELAQLISEGTPAPAKSAPVPAGSAVEIPAARAAVADAPQSAGEALAAAAGAVVAERAPEAIAAAATAPAAGAVPEVVVEEAPAEAAAPTGRARRFGEGVVLMGLQLIDLPFGWISELDKNVIGVAAFMLLLGGIVLFVMSRYM